ncbi:prolyl oligopeptidase family serine peptidase [Salirhabdus salicampi]|uniref:prolyl oligopeptidase family serine peptidase n=1 Tax=Salirhabdus salicampi TaxID=476102 RepID=UPI0020C4EC69|nr:prolyl oligopeptidase family serine peptidase [Salirhabdus salicampi]MCP8615560.1 prolyl oligopeptidase family serine peptidase [Salirhabdus salicampi]
MIQSIPTLVVTEQERADKPLPLIIYYHGFTSAKEHNLPFAYLMAQKGYRVLLPDSIHHGERDNGISTEEIQYEFWNIIFQNIQEISIIKTEAEKNNWIKDNRIGLAGTSMGGITTSAALGQYDWIKTAAVLMGSPKLTDMATFLLDDIKKKLGSSLPITDDEIEKMYAMIGKIDLANHTDKLNNRPILFWHGDEDPVVPFDQAYSFYEEVKETYTTEENIRFIRDIGRGHKVSRDAILQTVHWFEERL